MLILDDLKTMSPSIRNAVDSDNYDEALGKQVNNSYSQILKQEREPAILARMTGKPLQFTQITILDDGLIRMGEPKIYTGSDIADIIISSVQKSKEICYPLTGSSWCNKIVKQLYLLVKGKVVARFDVKRIEPRKELTIEEKLAYTDATVICNCRHLSVAIISNPKTDNLPQDFLGNYSGKSIRESALKGSCPNIYVL